MTLGIAIPVIWEDVKHLTRVLDSLQHSTKKPDKVSISSPCNLDDYIINKYDFEIIVTNNGIDLPTTKNRNIAASKLNTDIISFIDADDASHILRSEFLMTASQNSDIIVHNYHQTNTYDKDFIFSEINSRDIYYNYIDSMGEYGFPFSSKEHLPYACGHVTVTKKIFDRIKFDETWTSIGEDIMYLRSIMSNNYKITYIPYKLTNYIK
jgi:hypothetical protein